MQERYVTSEAIKSIIKEINEDVIPAIKEWRALVDSTDVPDLGLPGGLGNSLPGWMSIPGWGVVGEVVIGVRYHRLQDDVRDKFTEAISVLETWTHQLDTAQRNWRTAEDQSTAVYV
ncbi:hypothetical protein [Sphaerisporangium perillae]|uniref:hypothetical protein n=1 Tax=Sphaerisporangium perillae TaxID=2935860 RepID=UPI0020100697|nr:hypothetical protein [Sphaerisporangium perillae]